jgi:predicted transcriptional regulator of viral defense system
VGAVLRRLGFLLEIYDLGTPKERESLRRKLTTTYVCLDPVLPAEGRYLRRWRLQLNVTSEELQAVGKT